MAFLNDSFSGIWNTAAYVLQTPMQYAQHHHLSWSRISDTAGKAGSLAVGALVVGAEKAGVAAANALTSAAHAAADVAQRATNATLQKVHAWQLGSTAEDTVEKSNTDMAGEVLVSVSAQVREASHAALTNTYAMASSQASALGSHALDVIQTTACTAGSFAVDTAAIVAHKTGEAAGSALTQLTAASVDLAVQAAEGSVNAFCGLVDQAHAWKYDAIEDGSTSSKLMDLGLDTGLTLMQWGAGMVMGVHNAVCATGLGLWQYASNTAATPQGVPMIELSALGKDCDALNDFDAQQVELVGYVIVEHIS